MLKSNQNFIFIMKLIAFFMAFFQLVNSQLIREKIRGDLGVEGFVFNLTGKQSDTKGKGGTQKFLTAAQWPSLFNKGVSFILLSLEPCSINLHNVHQYATEIIYVIDAEKLQVNISILY